MGANVSRNMDDDNTNPPDYRPPSLSSWSSSGAGGINTPSHTTAATKADFEMCGNAESTYSRRPASTFTVCGGTASVPEPGRTYMIREAESDRAMALVDGELTLVRDPGTRGGWHWRCEEHPKKGWLGFRDAVGGKYLGHDIRGGYVARAIKHDSWEWFMLRPREKGGYNLYVRHWDGFKFVGIADHKHSKPKLVDASGPDTAARWLFIEV